MNRIKRYVKFLVRVLSAIPLLVAYAVVVVMLLAIAALVVVEEAIVDVLAFVSEKFRHLIEWAWSTETESEEGV